MSKKQRVATKETPEPTIATGGELTVFDVYTNNVTSGQIATTLIGPLPNGDFTVKAITQAEGMDSLATTGRAFAVDTTTASETDPSDQDADGEDLWEEKALAEGTGTDFMDNGIDVDSYYTVGLPTNGTSEKSAQGIRENGGNLDLCTGKTVVHIVRWYLDLADTPIPLRCGRWWQPANKTKKQGWGYRKFVGKGRWDPWFSKMISATLRSPFVATPEGANNHVYMTECFTYCDPPYAFRVVVVKNKPDGTIYMRGVLNAYKKY